MKYKLKGCLFCSLLGYAIQTETTRKMVIFYSKLAFACKSIRVYDSYRSKVQPTAFHPVTQHTFTFLHHKNIRKITSKKLLLDSTNQSSMLVTIQALFPIKSFFEKVGELLIDLIFIQVNLKYSPTWKPNPKNQKEAEVYSKENNPAVPGQVLYYVAGPHSQFNPSPPLHSTDRLCLAGDSDVRLYSDNI